MRYLFGLLLLLWAVTAFAEERPFLHPLFTDNMVLQREVAAPVWGWTTPGATVTVSMGGKQAVATAEATGKWLAKIGPFPAGGPYTLTVTGPHTVTVENVLVGDVWLCSGQSNMEMGISNVDHAQEEIAAANFPQLRLFTVAMRPTLTPQELTVGHWSVTTPENVIVGAWGGFSAAGYFFGRQLQQEMKIPIGLIHSSWGGTVAEAWTSAQGLQALPDFAPALAQLPHTEASEVVEAAQYPAALQQWLAKQDPEPAGKPARSAPEFDDSDWKSANMPASWAKAGLPRFRGVVWLRKEISVPDDGAGADVNLHLGQISDNLTVWFNGVQVGNTGETKDEKPTRRQYTVPGKLVKAGRNMVALRVLSVSERGGLLDKAAELFAECAVPDIEPISLAGPWRVHAGVALAAAPPLPVIADRNPNRVTVLFNGMIAPLLPFAIKGAIWYQGESNAANARQYQTLLPAMITDWRSRFGVGDFPFLIVQLANYLAVATEPGESAWAELREAQYLTTQQLPKTGLAVAIDIGAAGDIHPKNKQEVGRRLALNAEAIAYGQPVEYSGPVYRAMTVKDHAIELTFDHLGGGLLAKGGKLQGFAIAGDDKHWVWADAVIQGATILVSSPQVHTPTAVRYAWANNPICNLYNAAGLPAVPFRTDR